MNYIQKINNMISSPYIYNKLYYTILSILLITATNAYSFSARSTCQSYEQKLHHINSTIKLNKRQSIRYHHLLKMQQQARRDAERFSCLPGLFRKASLSKECQYIQASLARLDNAMKTINVKAASAQQKRLKMAIYQDMQHYGCRNPQILKHLIQQNRQASAPRNRYRKTSAGTTPVQQAVIAPVEITEPAAEARPDVVSVKFGANDTPIIKEPNIAADNKTKATEHAPPPVSKAIDYTSDPTIRRVGPQYWPAR